MTRTDAASAAPVACCGMFGGGSSGSWAAGLRGGGRRRRGRVAACARRPRTPPASSVAAMRGSGGARTMARSSHPRAVCLRGDDVGARARGAAPPRGARARDGRRRARRAPARARQLTVRERIERLFDPGTFHETGALAGSAALRRRRRARAASLPANMVVGTGRIEGRRRGRPGRRLHRPRRRRGRRHLAEDGLAPSARRTTCACRWCGWSTGRAAAAASRRSSRWASPTCRRSRASSWWSRTSRACRSSRRRSVRSPGWAPRASWRQPLLRDRARTRAQLFVAGPPVVAAAMGESPDKEELGGARAQTRAGAVDNEAADEDDALDQLRRFLSYLPDNAWEAPPIAAAHATRPTAARRRCCRSCRATRASPYEMRDVLEAVLDRGSLFELGARYGRLADHRAGAARRPPGRRARLRPASTTAAGSPRRVGQARALRRHLRPVPPAGRQLRRPARAS